MEFILGVDGGATKTIFRAEAIKSKNVIEFMGGSSNYKSDGLNKTRENIITGIKKIVEKIKNEIEPEFNGFISACFGLSGYDFENDRKVYEEIIFSRDIGNYFNPLKTIICNDTKIGLAAGSNNENGIIFISGTGSICYGKNSLGLEVKVCAWDYVLGDQGSGYEIGVKALRAMMKAYDGRGPKTLLSDAILSYLKINSIPELLNWTYSEPFSKSKISSLAKILYMTAERGDKESLRILNEEISEIISSISTAIKRLHLQNNNFDLVLMGSVFRDKKFFTDIIINKIKTTYPNSNITYLRKQPVEGAIKLAILNSG